MQAIRVSIVYAIIVKFVDFCDEVVDDSFACTENESSEICR